MAQAAGVSLYICILTIITNPKISWLIKIIVNIFINIEKAANQRFVWPGVSIDGDWSVVRHCRDFPANGVWHGSNNTNDNILPATHSSTIDCKS